MITRLAFALIVLLGACGTQPARNDPPAGDQSLLAGEWGARLQLGNDSVVDGALRLVAMPAPPQLDTGGPYHPFVSGAFDLGRAGDRAEPPRDSTVTGHLANDGTLFLQLYVSGNCGDCGNILIRGRLERDTIRGYWYHEYLQEPPSRPVTLWRIAPPRP